MLQLRRSDERGLAKVHIHADAALYAGLFDAGESAELAIDPVRKAYVHLVRGSLTVNGQALHAGDALRVQGESRLASFLSFPIFIKEVSMYTALQSIFRSRQRP